jgi:hypothetical protein
MAGPALCAAAVLLLCLLTVTCRHAAVKVPEQPPCPLLHTASFLAFLSTPVHLSDAPSTYTPLQVAVLDEVQMVGDPGRGWAWTRALLGLRAREVHVCGDPAALPLLQQLAEQCGDELQVKGGRGARGCACCCGCCASCCVAAMPAVPAALPVPVPAVPACPVLLVLLATPCVCSPAETHPRQLLAHTCSCLRMLRDCLPASL